MIPKKASRFNVNLRPKFLCASDIQLDTKNTHHWQTVVHDLIRYADQYSVDTLFLLGDLKEPTSPIPGAVLNAAVQGLQALKGVFSNVVALLGNHDYYSPSGGESWADLLRHCGLHVVSQPTNYSLGGRAFAIIPYQHNKSKFAEVVAEYAQKPADILLFHQGLNRAQLNVLTVATDELDPDTLRAFPLAIGGHYHHQHNVPNTNVWYCGSPFCSKWDEANQTKGYLLVDEKNQVVQLPSSIPGWYNASWPNFPSGPLPVGARVRVPLEYGKEPPSDQQVQAARAQIAQKLGTDVDVDVQLKQKDLGNNYKPPVETEAEAISTFFNVRNLPEGVEAQELLLSALQGLQSSAMPCMEVLSVEAVNTLGFEKVQFECKPGMHVIHGANGTGKSSLLHLLPAALFGETLKGQVGPELRRERSTGSSYVKAVVKNSEGQVIEVTRSRVPQFVKITVDGVDVTSGTASNLKQQVYSYTGFNLEMLRSALYVDQRVISGLLRGEPAEQRMLLNAFCGLERYATAAKKLKEQLAEVKQARGNERVTVASLQSRITVLAEQRWNAIAANERIAQEQAANVSEIEKQLQACEIQQAELAAEVEKWQRQLTTRNVELREAQETVAKAVYAHAAEEAALKSLKQPKATCSYCGAATDATKLQCLKEQYDREHKERTASVAAKQQEITVARETVSTITTDISRMSQEKQVVHGKWQSVAAQVASYRREIEKAQRVALVPVPVLAKDRIKLVMSKARLEHLEEMEKVYAAAIAACDTKSGVPAMLTEQLLPRLNGAARAVASDLDTTVRVEFTMEKEVLEVRVSNENGGSSLHSQSNGETQLATTIVTLALRSLVRSNVLVLDEPSLGLDSVNSPHLADVINGLRSRYCTILVVSHDSNFAQYLDVTQLWKTEKKDGVCILS